MIKKDIIFLIEPFYHGVQYINVVKKIGCELVILRRTNGPLLENVNSETIIVDLFDIQSVINVIKERTAINYKNIGIIPGNELCVPIVAEINKRLGLRGNSPEAATAARNKILMRERLNINNVKCPKSVYYTDIDDIVKAKNQFIFPVVVKPSDMTGSMYVKLVENFDELLKVSIEIFNIENNVLNYPVFKEVMIEEYVNGPEFSIELFCDDGVLKFASVTEKHKGSLPYFVEMGHVVPSSITNDEQNQNLIETAFKAVLAIGVEYGPAHVEIVLSKNGPSVIELAARIGGDNIMHLVKLASNIYLPYLTVQQVLKQNYNDKLNNVFYRGAAIRFLTAKPGRLMNISGVDTVKICNDVIDVNIDINIGDFVYPLLNSDQRVGDITVVAESGKTAWKRACDLSKEINFSIK